VIAIFSAALFPCAVYALEFDRLGETGGYLWLFQAYGVAWCALLAFAFARATSRQRWRLLLLLPLSLFAFVSPALRLAVWLGVYWAEAQGRALP
jgi:hypothetical protein